MKISTKKKITRVSTYSDFLNIHAFFKKFLQLLFLIKSLISIQFEITLRILVQKKFCAQKNLHFLI
jgi:hypothetical protein